MSDDFGSKLLQLMLVKALEGESQIQEHIQWDVRTKGWMPLAQALGAAIGIAAMVLGLALLGFGATRAIDIELTLMDALLIGVSLLLALGVAIVIMRQVVQSATIVAAGLGTVLVLLFLSAVLMAIFGEIDLIAGISLALAPAILAAGLALTYRQLVDLLDPFGKVSPVERQLFPYLKDLFVGTQEQAGRLTVPYRINGALREPMAAMSEDGEPVVRIHRDDLALIEFIHEASERGLSRRKWLEKGRASIVLPRSGVEVGRDIYDDMMARLAEWGIVSPGGEGKAHHWMMQPDQAIEIIEGEIVAQLVEGQRV